ncbi:MAG: flagellar basal body P-ring protein FlgI [Planctomycetes bacterium]|nr:flagellar basal body P-ring protein FlgI [Planctomycetota bacterium]
MKIRLPLIVLVVFVLAGAAVGARIKDICEIQGVRGNTLRGIGLVVGLNGTGDGSIPSSQMLASLLRREGITLDSSVLTSKNIALVTVTAELGPWDRMGSRIDIDVAAIGEAKSLQGGMLLATELKGADDQVYAVARAAAISTSSWTVEGKTGSQATKNHPTVGRIPNGAYVEREELATFVEDIGGMRYITLNLRNGDFTTAERIGRGIGGLYPESCYVQDAGTIRVRVPSHVTRADEVGFLAEISQVDIEVDMPAVVVINERTGTIVVGGNVGISETAVAQGSLVVKIREQPQVSQPGAPFTDSATTAIVESSSLGIMEEEGYLIPVPHVVTVEELANALNAIGATPRDLIAIFNALKMAGALQARIEMM